MPADLHCHTDMSDGSLGVDDLIALASRAGLDAIAVTDHDTMESVSRAQELGRDCGLRVIPGTELSCYDSARKRKAHILCYMPQKPEELEDVFSRVQKARTEASLRSLREVMRLYPVTEEHVARYSRGKPAIYRMHIMRALIDLGFDTRVYGALYVELFDSAKGSCYHGFKYPDVYESLEAVHRAGGIAVLAHPVAYDSMDLLSELAEKGCIQGVEVHHPGAGEADEKAIADMAERFGLIKTGGSDFHGFYTGKPRPIAGRLAPGEAVDALFACKKQL